MTDQPNFAPPSLSDVMGFRGVHVLGTMRYDEDGRAQLTASHYASCLVFGPRPLWGVWTAAGKFLRFYAFKEEIAKAYPKLIWRRRMASWQLLAVDDLKADARRRFLGDKYKSPVPTQDE
jgi:hypothetical protein